MDIVADDSYRSAAAQAGVTDEQMLIHDAGRAFSTAETITAAAASWLRYVAPVENAISRETIDIISKAFAIRVMVLARE